MSLTLKDRLKGLVRVFRILCDPNVDYINIMWQKKSENVPDGARVFIYSEKKAIYTHTFYMEGEKPVNTMLTYMAHVAAQSDDLDSLNTRCEYYLNKVAVAYMRIKPDSDFKLEYIGQPIRKVPKNERDPVFRV